jgi:cleavage and polyadenylation specificity factor subunit 1
MRLECVCSWQLHAPVQDLAAVRLAGSNRDALLLSFLDAKLSLVEYSPDTHDLRTVSLHIFEDEALRGGYTHNHFVPTIRVDPENRYAH